MVEIKPLRPDQAAEARQVIYRIAHRMFNPEMTLEAASERYGTTWPLHDVLEFERKYLENGGTFLTLCDGERIVGTGAIWRLEQGVAEIKRLWILPEYQGQGLGYRMMLDLIDFARRQGYKILRLETSPQYQPRAYAFYRHLGFVDIPRYGDDPDDVAMEMVL